MIYLYWGLAVVGIVGDAIALYFAFHSRRHERENTDLLREALGLLYERQPEPEKNAFGEW